MSQDFEPWFLELPCFFFIFVSSLADSKNRHFAVDFGLMEGRMNWFICAVERPWNIRLKNFLRSSKSYWFHVFWFTLHSFPIRLVTKRLRFLCGKFISKRHKRLTIYFQLSGVFIIEDIDPFFNIRTWEAPEKGNTFFYCYIDLNVNM